MLLAAAIIAGAALSVDVWSGLRVVVCVAGAVGLFAIHERLRHEFAAVVATFSSLLIYAASSLFWTMNRGASVGDAIAFAIVAVLAFAAPRMRTMRSRNLAWTVMAAVPIVLHLTASPGDAASASRAPLFDALFSSARGFFSLTPIAYAAAIGLLVYGRTARTATIVTLAIVLAWVLIVDMTPRAPDAVPFDHRLTPALALLAPGLAAAIDWMRMRPLAAMAPAVVFVVAWNYWLMVQYTVGWLPKDAPVEFAAMVRQQADVHTQTPYFYPFAFPANALFAWRQGLPVDRYEILAGVPARREFDVALDRRADPFLLEGWGGAGTTPHGPVRWTAARRATLAAPLVPAESDVRVEVVAAARVEEPSVGVEVTVQINGHDVGRFVALPSPVTAALTVPGSNVGRVLRAGYNRVTIVNHGIHRLDPADPRPLGPLAARSAEIPFPVAVYRVRISPGS